MNSQKIFTFKTNINCAGCIAKIAPILDAEKEIISWKVDVQNPNKILTVVSSGIGEDEIIEIVKKKGFDIHQYELF